MRHPITPFSTHLSGDAKETQLRLRSIFQWSKKRPPVLLLAVLMVLSLGCGTLVSVQAAGQEEYSSALFYSQEEAREHILFYLEQTYDKEFKLLSLNRNLFSGLGGRFEALCTDGQTDFKVRMFPDEQLTDSFGVSSVTRRLEEAATLCADQIGAEDVIKKIIWRQEGLYRNDSDDAWFLDVDPGMPLAEINRIHNLFLKNISDPQHGLETVRGILAGLEKRGMNLTYVNVSFRVEQNYYHLITGTEQIKTVVAEDMWVYTPDGREGVG